MRLRLLLSVVLSLSVWPVSVGTFDPPAFGAIQTGFQLPTGCSLPFADIASVHEIDLSCTASGTASSHFSAATQAKQFLQNRAKNNFCASGIAVPLTLTDYLTLQQHADAAGISRKGTGGIPSDRSPLRQVADVNGTMVGEGSIVATVGLLDRADYSNTSSGEHVNCKRGGGEDNDIHIDLAEIADPTGCEKMIAEISPHRRPEFWERPALQEVLNQDLPVRITGHLFWYASHGPCSVDSYRATAWEIHPVYAVDVCSELVIEECSATNESVWTPLHLWDPHGEETGEAPPVNPPIPLGSVSMSILPVAERVQVRNEGTAVLNLSRWLLISVRGDQRFIFPDGTTLAPGGQVVVASGPTASDSPPAGELFWTRRSVWSNNEPDPARLFDRDGRLIVSVDG